MSRIQTFDARARQLGRLRIGDQVAGDKGTRPRKLEAFRATSSHRDLLEALAARYGGEVKPWETSKSDDRFEVYLGAAELEIVLPPSDHALSQFMELWSGGGCQLRCDGVTDLISDLPCRCAQMFADEDERRSAAADGKACKPTTRLSVMIPDAGDLGLWRLDTHGWNAARELTGTHDLLRALVGHDRMLPARLALESRSSKSGSQTRRFVVPVLRPAAGVNLFTGQSLAAGAPADAPALPAGETVGRVLPSARLEDTVESSPATPDEQPPAQEEDAPPPTSDGWAADTPPDPTPTNHTDDPEARAGELIQTINALLGARFHRKPKAAEAWVRAQLQARELAGLDDANIDQLEEIARAVNGPARDEIPWSEA